MPPRTNSSAGFICQEGQPVMFRIIRTATLHSLRSEAATVAEVCEESAVFEAEAEEWHSRHNETRKAFDDAMKQLGRAYADCIQAERERNELRAQREQDKAATEQQLAEIRADFTRLRDAAADTETGDTVRGALAYNVLRDLYADAWARGLLPKRPFDVLAAVLGFEPKPQPATTA